MPNDFKGTGFQQNRTGDSTGLERTTHNFYFSLNTLNGEKSIKIEHISVSNRTL
jgi:hypothetical protein